MKFCTFWRWKFTKLSKFSAPKIAKNSSFITCILSKNLFHLESEWQKNPEISTLHCVLTFFSFQAYSSLFFKVRLLELTYFLLIMPTNIIFNQSIADVRKRVYCCTIWLQLLNFPQPKWAAQLSKHFGRSVLGQLWACVCLLKFLTKTKHRQAGSTKIISWSHIV